MVWFPLCGGHRGIRVISWGFNQNVNHTHTRLTTCELMGIWCWVKVMVLAPGTPIQDIVDRCRVWESHADSADRRGREPRTKQALPIDMVEDVGEAWDDLHVPVVAVTASPTAPALLEAFLRRLLPTPVVLPPDPTSVPSELQRLLQRLLGDAQPAQPVSSGKLGVTAIKTLLQNVLPVSPPPSSRTQPDARRRDWTAVFFFCVWANGSWGHQMSHIGHYVTLLAAGMEGGESRDLICYDISSCAGGAPLGGKRWLIRGGRVSHPDQ